MSRVVVAALVGLAACGGGDDGGPPPDAAPAALAANAGADVYAIVGEPVALDGSASTGAAQFLWDFGNGERWDAPRGDARATVTYAAPGRYQAVITAIDAAGARRTDAVVVSVTWPLTWTPRHAATIVALPPLPGNPPRFAAVSTDTDELVVLEPLRVLWRAPTCDEPRTVTPWHGDVAVVCGRGDAVELIALDGAVPARRVALPRGAGAHGAAWIGDDLWVALGGTGELARITPAAEPGGTPVVAGRWRALPDARGAAAWPDGRIAVTRWRSPDDGATIALVDPAGPPEAAPPLVRLAVDPQAGSDTELGGVPSYLDQVLVSPTGREAALPSLQANLLEGTFRSPRPLTFETTLRAVVSWIAIEPSAALDPAEDFDRRKQFDDRGLAAGGVFSSHGDYLFVAMPGNRTVERLDVLGGGAQSGTLLEVGFAPDGVALSADDRTLAVLAPLSREIVVYDVTSFDTLPQPFARVRLVTAEPLPAAELRGKQLFHDAADERLAKDGYIACAHCHLDGLSDNRTWDFTDRGEGLRNTIALGGRRGTGDGPVHWSANFDEIQDFEHDLRGPFGGRGLLTDAEFHTGTRDTTLGDAKAGVSADLDALAAYVASVPEPKSPFRNPDGSLPAAAARGRDLFGALGCASCHAGPRLTDSGFVAPGMPRLHDVGTLGAGSGQRLGGPLTGLDTPTLHGLWHSPPYLHDGSAATLRDVLTTRNAGGAHGPTSALTSAELDDLARFLLCLDGTAD